MGIIKRILLFVIVISLLGATVQGAMTIVATTTVYADPIAAIGGSHVEVIAVADPTVCPHLQGDIIDSRIQMQKEFIASGEHFFHHDSASMDGIAKSAIDRFLDANYGRTVSWITMPEKSWNTPDRAKSFAKDIRDALIGLDPANAADYEMNYLSYLERIDAVDLTEYERLRFSAVDVIVIEWQREAAETWLGMRTVAKYGPDFYMGGQFAPVKIVDEINANPGKFRTVRYVIENMQSGELAKGIEEALHDHGIMAERVIFTNFPRSVQGVESIPDVIAYNKGQVTPEDHPVRIVTTTSVYADPIRWIGGEQVEVIAVADPTVCPHLQGDIIDSRIQMQKDFIASGEYFFHHDSASMDGIAKSAIDRFLDANYGRTVTWITMEEKSWNTPDKAKRFAGQIKEKLIEIQPWHAAAFEERYLSYCQAIDYAGYGTAYTSGQDVIVIEWQREAAETWLGLKTVAKFGPEFYMGGQFSPVKVVDDINANPEKYRTVKYIIENLQSGEMAKGIEEALHDHGIPAGRLVFTNFPQSVQGVETLPDVLRYNLNLVTDWEKKSREAASGSDVGATYLAKAASMKAGETASFAFDGCAISVIQLVYHIDMNPVTMTAKELDRVPAALNEPDGIAYRYLEISADGADISGCRVQIDFSIEEEWFADHGVSPEDIILTRYSGGAWHPMETGYTGSVGGYARFTAETTGFSYFAIMAVVPPPMIETVSPVATAAAVTPAQREAVAATSPPATPDPLPVQVAQTPQSPITILPLFGALFLIALLMRRI